MSVNRLKRPKIVEIMMMQSPANSLHLLQQKLIKSVVPEIVTILKDTIAKDLLSVDCAVANKDITVDHC